MGHETEIKLGVPDAAAARARIEAAGARQLAARRLQDDRLFDLPGEPVARAGRLLRLRAEAGRAVLTGKGPREAGAFKTRREEEAEVDDADSLAAVLEAAGLVVSWRYQKYRTTWELAGATVALDETPEGCFLEIEGEPERIDAAAAALGFSRDDYLTDTYREIHERRCAERGVPAGDMLFGGSEGRAVGEEAG